MAKQDEQSDGTKKTRKKRCKRRPCDPRRPPKAVRDIVKWAFGIKL